MLSKKYRLPKEKFQYIYKKGEKFRGKYGMLIAVSTDEMKSPKLGIVVSKKIGNSVKRHRMTRLVRNIFLNTVKENNLKNTPLLLEYIAFEYCDNYKLLEEELSKQIEEALK